MRDAAFNLKPLVYVYIISFLKRKSPAEAEPCKVIISKEITVRL